MSDWFVRFVTVYVLRCRSLTPCSYASASQLNYYSHIIELIIYQYFNYNIFSAKYYSSKFIYNSFSFFNPASCYPNVCLSVGIPKLPVQSLVSSIQISILSHLQSSSLLYMARIPCSLCPLSPCSLHTPIFHHVVPWPRVFLSPCTYTSFSQLYHKYYTVLANFSS